MISSLCKLALTGLVSVGTARAGVDLDLKIAAFHPVPFDHLKPTVFADTPEGLRMEVDKSSSSLLRPFEQALVVSQVDFEWRSTGPLAVASAAAQKTKAGDDARLRVGLILGGEPPMIPFLAPTWVKVIRDVLKAPAGELVFVLAGTPVAPLTRWKSPYSDDITLIAASDADLKDGWRRAQVTFSKAQDVVGVWLMADGDNTGSRFTTWLRRLTLK